MVAMVTTLEKSAFRHLIEKPLLALLWKKSFRHPCPQSFVHVILLNRKRLAKTKAISKIKLLP